MDWLRQKLQPVGDQLPRRRHSGGASSGARRPPPPLAASDAAPGPPPPPLAGPQLYRPDGADQLSQSPVAAPPAGPPGRKSAPAGRRTGYGGGLRGPDPDGSPSAAAASAQPSPASRWRQRQQRFAACIERSDGCAVDMEELRALARDGLPEAHRAVCWKLLLGYLPPRRADWAATLRQRREQYRAFRKEFIVVPPSVRRATAQGSTAQGSAGGTPLTDRRGDHPLASSVDSEWSRFQANRPIFAKVDKDIPRTQPALHFFHAPVTEAGEAARLSPRGGRTPASLGGDVSDVACVEPAAGAVLSAQQQRLRRLLFLYALLNPGLSYVQGMNEIAAMLFYAFATCPNPAEDSSADCDDAEADAFFCFSSLLGQLGDAFCRALDSSGVGIHGTIAHFSSILRLCDRRLWDCLEERGVRPELYALRWLALLLSQEFPAPDVLRIWDFLLSGGDEQGSVYSRLFFVAAAMVVALRRELMSSDFAANMQMLQDYPPCDVSRLLTGGRLSAHALYEKHRAAAPALTQC
eukprot:TRINITY_DN35050_c0_g1_i1.p1 TRINITY_DN35050_c0_g1~~TRINITY_DN35050_c0_g1_i1.p1  ORF type:complete len:522 (+),score=103.77 TRINITY_DN35050_c0_g1_i1:89-1654(+)